MQGALRAKPQGAEIQLGHRQSVNTVIKIAQINALVVFVWQLLAIHRVDFPGVIVGLDLTEVIPHTLPRLADSTGAHVRDMRLERYEKKVKPGGK